MTSHAVVLHNSKILLLLRDNLPTISNPNCWTTIGGGVESGETPEEALIREVKEETNIIPSQVEFLTQLPSLNAHVFIIKLTDKEASSVKLGNEGQKLEFFSADELDHILLTPILKENLSTLKDLMRS